MKGVQTSIKTMDKKKLYIIVGSGIGPLTIAPVAFTALTIFSDDLSTKLWS